MVSNNFEADPSVLYKVHNIPLLSCSFTSGDNWVILLLKILLSSFATSDDLASNFNLDITPSHNYFYDWLASFTLNNFLPISKIKNTISLGGLLPNKFPKVVMAFSYIKNPALDEYWLRASSTFNFMTSIDSNKNLPMHPTITSAIQ